MLKILKVSGVILVCCLLGTVSFACPRSKDKCECSTAKEFMLSNVSMMEESSALLAKRGGEMKEKAKEKRERKYEELNNDLSEHGQFLIEQAEIIMQNGKVVMMYAEEIEGDVFEIPDSQKMQAKMDAAKLIDNGKRMRRIAKMAREKSAKQMEEASYIQDMELKEEMKEHQEEVSIFLDTVIDNANAMISSGELLQMEVQ